MSPGAHRQTISWITTLAVCFLLSGQTDAAVLRVDRMKRQTSASTNDIICEQPNYQGNSRFPPPVKITYSDGTSACGCASDIATGAGASYQECNAIYPVFGTSGYNDPGLRQNLCYLDSNQVAQCGTGCTPNTQPKNDGSGYCQAYGTYTSSQAPTTVFTTSENAGQPQSSSSSSTYVQPTTNQDQQQTSTTQQVAQNSPASTTPDTTTPSSTFTQTEQDPSSSSSTAFFTLGGPSQNSTDNPVISTSTSFITESATPASLESQISSSFKTRPSTTLLLSMSVLLASLIVQR